MIDKETYKREVVRMWDSIRTTNKGEHSCDGVNCKDCPLNQHLCKTTIDVFDVYDFVEVVEKWSKEHPQKHKVSQTEFEILQSLYKYSSNLVQFCDFRFLLDMIEKGYFDGANGITYIRTYIDLCEVEEK